MTMASSQPDSQSTAEEPGDPAVDWSYRLTQLLFICVGLVCFAIFWYAGQLLGIPAEPRHGGSLLRQPTIGASLTALICAPVLLLGCTLLAGAFLRTRWFLAGLAAATAGLSAWSMRGGPMHEVTQYASSAGVFIWLAIELLILCGIVAGLWLLFWRAPTESEGSIPKASVVGAIITQTLCMGVIVLVLAQTDAKKQCVAAVFLGGLIASSLVESSFRAPLGGRWYWIAPLAVGLFGYLFAVFQNPAWADTPRILQGALAPLARPLPLDYASAGMFGTLLGYWINSPAEEGITLVGVTDALQRTQPS
jgi:hypothetical protein